jgi:excisionase family DNA binding protein
MSDRQTDKNDDQMVVTLKVGDLRQIIRDEIAASNRNGEKSKDIFNTEQAAMFLNVKPSWLAAAAREGKIPVIRFGHYVNFHRSDLQQFIEKSKSKREPNRKVQIRDHER